MFAPVNTPDLSAVPKPSQLTDQNLEVDPMGSSPSSPAPPSETSSSVVGGATPMPLLPTLSQSTLHTPNTHTHVNHPTSRLAPHPAILQPAQARGGSACTPGFFRTDPGAPPGCFEHSLNILGGRYLLLDQLEGSHLQRCIDVYSKQEFVCKTVRNDPCGQAMLTAHNRVDGHAHINPLQEVIVGDKYSYLLFPPCSTDLHSYVRTRRRLREPHARILFRQIVSAVHEAHTKGLVLRDLKLRKFVFTDDSRHLTLGFGTAFNGVKNYLRSTSSSARRRPTASAKPSSASHTACQGFFRNEMLVMRRYFSN